MILRIKNSRFPRYPGLLSFLEDFAQEFASAIITRARATIDERNSYALEKRKENGKNIINRLR